MEKLYEKDANQKDTDSKGSKSSSEEVNVYRIMLTKIYVDFLKSKGAVLIMYTLKHIIVNMQNIENFDD